MGEPSRSYSWAPFHEGNTAALKHGADSPNVVRPLADELACEIVKVAPWLDSPAFADEVADWAFEAARVRLLRDWVNRQGLLDEESEGARNQLDRARAAASKARANLGLNPVAWAKLLESLRSHEEEAGTEVEGLRQVGRDLVSKRRAAIEAAGRAEGEEHHHDDEDGGTE